MEVPGKEIPVLHNFPEYEDKIGKIILGPVSYFIQTVPADIWEEFAKAFNYWLNVPEKVFEEVANNFRYFYYGDRLFETIRDNSPPSVCDEESCISIYGEPCTVNALYQIHLTAAKNLALLNQSKAPALYFEQIEEACIARYMEQEWNETAICPTEAEYYHMIVKQTFGHFGAQIKFLQLYSSNQHNFRKLSVIFGLFLRILEDYRYFVSADKSDSKIYLPDETLARFSLPIIHAIKSDTVDGDKVMHLFRQRTNGKELKTYVVQLLEKIGSLEYTRKTLMKLREEALVEMRKFETNPLLESIFDKYFKILIPSDTVAAEASVDSIKNTSETLQISYYLNQMENVESDENVKKILLKSFHHLNELRQIIYIGDMFNILKRIFNIPDDKLAILENFWRYFAYGFILMDDIQDKSILRKRIPCAHLVYGVMHTINGIFYTIAISLKTLLTLDYPQVVDLFYTNVLVSGRGQGMEVYWRDNSICPTEEEYVQMINGKTGGSVRLILSLVKMFGNTTIDVDTLCTNLSVYLQVRDDYENLIGQEYHDAKGFCEDITEGKFGFPTIHAVNTHPNVGKKLKDILRQRTYDVEVKKSYLSLLEKCGSFEYTREKLKEIRKMLMNPIEQLPQKNEVAAFLMKKFHITFVDEQTDKTFMF